MTPPVNTSDTGRVRAVAVWDMQAHRADSLFRRWAKRLPILREENR